MQKHQFLRTITISPHTPNVKVKKQVFRGGELNDFLNVCQERKTNVTLLMGISIQRFLI